MYSWLPWVFEYGHSQHTGSFLIHCFLVQLMVRTLQSYRVLQIKHSKQISFKNAQWSQEIRAGHLSVALNILWCPFYKLLFYWNRFQSRSFRCMQDGLPHLSYLVDSFGIFFFSFLSGDGQRRDYSSLGQKLSGQYSVLWTVFNLSLQFRKCHDGQLYWPCCPRTRFSKEHSESPGAGASPSMLLGRCPHGKKPISHSSVWRGMKNHCTTFSVFSFC